MLAFAVGLGRAPPVPALEARATGPTARELFSRWLFFFGVLSAVGAAAFILLVLRPVGRRLGLSIEPTAAIVLVFCGLIVAFFGAAGLAAYHHHSVVTRSGLVYAIGAMLSSLGAAAAVIRILDRTLPLLPLPFIAALVPVPAFAGHAFDAGQPRWLSTGVDMLHVAAAGVWLGGLIALAVVAPRIARTVSLDVRSAFWRGVVGRFSAVALVSVVAVASSGFLRALFELDRVSQLWSSAYGRTLLVKSALLMLLVAVGWQNRQRFVPRMSRGVAGGAQLGRNIRIEVGLLAGVLVAVAVLTDLPPGRELARPSRAANSQASFTYRPGLPRRSLARPD